MKQLAIGLLAIIFLIAAIGCVAMSEYITPATIDQKAIQYAAEAGVIDPNDYTGYGNLDKANRLKDAVDAAFQVKSLIIKQLQERNELDYYNIKQIMTSHLITARQREEIFFGEKGILPLAAGLLGFGGLTGVLGLMRKRPGDYTPAEMEAKARQMAEIVKGVKTFLDKHPKGDRIGDELRRDLAAAQSADTKAEVAIIKAAI